MSSEDVKNYDIAQASSGVQYITDGYIEYAKAVVTGRALPDLRDGLKPVNRYIMYSIHESKLKRLAKSSKLATAISSYHPHGETSAYAALVLMTDRNGSYQFPLIKGQGNWGHFTTNAGAAAMRYTEAMLHDNAKEFFGEMNGIKMLPNFDATLLEPEVLPVSFPAVLVNATSGIAVGFKANIPSFNFTDVCNLVKEYVTDGACSTVIYPDFVSGGYYIKDNKELMKLMRTGKAKLKLRGKAMVNGKDIDIVELPFGKVLQNILTQINDNDFKSIKSAYEARDLEHDTIIAVECKSKSVVDEVLYYLYKDTDFQYTYSADITVVQDGTPKTLGVWGVIEEWVKWRREVLSKDLKIRLENLIEESRQNRAFAEIIKHTDLKEQLLLIISRDGADAGAKFIIENYDNEIVPTDLAGWCCRRRASEFHKGGKYVENYNACLGEINRVQAMIDDVDSVIVSQMDGLIAKYGSSMPRRTEVTTTDYEFVEDKQEKVIERDNTTCVFDYKSGFLRKMRVSANDSTVKFQMTGSASDTLIAFDNRGRILRIYCEDLPIHSPSDTGLYLPRYFGFEESDDWTLTWMGVLDGEKYMLLYKDGNVGFVDTNEWINNNRNVKVLERGIASSCADVLGAVIPMSSISEDAVLMVTDVDGRLAWSDIAGIKQKDRTAKTRVFKLKKNALIDSYCILKTSTELISSLSESDEFYGGLRDLNNNEFHGDASAFKLI